MCVSSTRSAGEDIVTRGGSTVDDEQHDRGLAHDLEVLRGRVSRRQVLRWAGGLSLLPVLGCRSTAATAAPSGATRSARTAACTAVPEETAGPFPGDGSNGVNALATSGIVRSD